MLIVAALGGNALLRPGEPMTAETNGKTSVGLRPPSRSSSDRTPACGHALLLLTDVDAVYRDWGGRDQASFGRVSPRDLAAHTFPAGSMGPKVAAGCRFVEHTGGFAGIGRLEDALAILRCNAGTVIVPG